MNTIKLAGALAAPLLMLMWVAPSRADDAPAATTCKDGTTLDCNGPGRVQRPWRQAESGAGLDCARFGRCAGTAEPTRGIGRAGSGQYHLQGWHHILCQWPRRLQWSMVA